MDIKSAKKAISLCAEAGVTLYIWGHRGIGKSSIVEQVAQENNIGFINLRCSQIEASDIRGLPDKSNGRTVYLPPADLPIAEMEFDEYAKIVYPEDKNSPYYWNGKGEDPYSDKRRMLAYTNMPKLKKGILFLDELNRAQDDVLQAAFELVLDRKVGQYVVPDGWSIVCAGNFQNGDYMTNNFNDAAFLDRFAHITLETGERTMNEWIQHISSIYGEYSTNVVQYASQDLSNLDGKVEGYDDLKIQPSRRSWEMVIKIEKIIEEDKKKGDNRKYDDEVRNGVIQGLVGPQGVQYVKFSCPVNARDLVNHGIDKYIKKLKSLPRTQLIGLMFGVSSFIKPKINKNKKYGQLAIDFARFILEKHHNDKDIVAAFLKNLLSNNDKNDHIRTAMVMNKSLMNLMKDAIDQDENDNSFMTLLMKEEDFRDMVGKFINIR